MWKVKSLFVLALVLILSGCATQQKGMRSSVVDYLYPQDNRTVKPSIPQLSLPLKVAIAFVPEQSAYGRGHDFNNAQISAPVLSEVLKLNLLEQVAASFNGIEYIDKIEIIPSAYLRPQGSFTNLKQIKTMYDVDVIALVSYDQIQFSSQNKLSLSYWTLVGAYFIEGDENDTSTLIDTVVYDIDSQKMLFRAPGQSQINNTSTAINLPVQQRTDSEAGFNIATENMITNLKQQLDTFEDKIKANPQQYQVTQVAGYQGGAVNIFVLMLLAFCSVIRKWFN